MHSSAHPRTAIVPLTTLILLGLAPAASARAVPLVPVHLPPVTLRSLEGVQSEIVDARTKLQRDRDRQHAKPAGSGDGQR
jgi:hypothetical protein